MKTALLVIGAIVLVAGVFGFLYSEDQQSVLQQAEDSVSGENTDWGLINNISLVAVIAGGILIGFGLIPEEHYSRDHS